MRRLFLVLMLSVVLSASAQIRIIPSEKLLEAANLQVAKSSLRFNAEMVDFGTIDEMSGVWNGSVKLRNVGPDTTLITRVKTTCGCLRADVEKRVLAPQEEISVHLKYYPRGHAGQITQRLFLYTAISDEKPSAILQLRGKVVASADRSDDYPHVRGVLRLRQDTVRLSGGEREILRVACMNGGSATLRPAVDTIFTDRRISVRFVPEILLPKQEGSMEVIFNPDGREEVGTSLKIYLKGVGATPRNSIVEAIIENRER